MTSGRRTVRGNAAVGGARGSLHLRGDAIDYVPVAGDTLQDTLRKANAYYGAGRASIHKGTHVHVSLPGYGRVPLYGKRGTQ